MYVVYELRNPMQKSVIILYLYLMKLIKILILTTYDDNALFFNQFGPYVQLQCSVLLRASLIGESLLLNYSDKNFYRRSSHLIYIFTDFSNPHGGQF